MAKANNQNITHVTGILSDAEAKKLAKERNNLHGGKVKKGIIHAVLILLCVFFLFPFVYMFNMSLMTDNQSIGNPETLFFPTKILIENYDVVFTAKFFNSLKNSMLIIIINLVTVPLSSSICAFGFTRCKFKGREVVFGVILATMMLPSIAIQIPLYVMYVFLGWANTILPLTIPAAFGGGAMNIFLIKQFMRGIPSSFDEAAVIDGANRFQVYFSIYLPLCTPILIFTMIGVFNGTWNDFASPLMFLRQEESYTLILYVYHLFSGALREGNYPNVQMATGIMLTLPAAAIFFLFQQQLIDGVSVGGVKG